MNVGIGVDMGGTCAKVVAVSPQGRALGSAQVPTLEKKGPSAFIRRTAKAVSALERRLGLRAQAVGFGAAGDVDRVRGCLRFAPNLRGFEGFPLRDALSRALGRPCVIENDANMAAWGAYVVELRKGVRNMLALTLGTGVGGGIVLDGKLYCGSTGSAGEFGHMNIVLGGELCGCGSRGCLEAYAGGRSIVRAAQRLLAERPSSRSPLRARALSLEPLDICKAAMQKDALAREVWRGAGEALGRGIANLVLLFNPDAVLLVGGVSKAGPLFMPALRAQLRKNPFRAPVSHARVMVGTAKDLGALGAGLLSLE